MTTKDFPRRLGNARNIAVEVRRSVRGFYRAMALDMTTEKTLVQTTARYKDPAAAEQDLYRAALGIRLVMDRRHGNQEPAEPTPPPPPRQGWRLWSLFQHRKGD